MRLKFYHDSEMIFNNKNDKYYSIGFHYKIWERYLSVFDKITVHTRARFSGNIEEKYKISSGDNVYIEPIKSYESIKSFWKLIFVWREIKKTIKNGDAFIVRLPSVIGYIAGLVLILKRKKYYVEIVGCGFETFYYKGGKFSKILAYPSGFLQRLITKNADVSTYITDKYLQSKYPTRGKSFGGVSNVSFQFSKSDSDRINNRIVKFLEKDKNQEFKIGLIGSLNVNYKGHDLAIEAIHMLVKKGYNVKLYLVGAGDLNRFSKEITKYNLSDKVIHYGIIPAEEGIYNFLDSLDFYIQPSITEGHGRALVEAVYRGCICFGTNVGGIPDTLNKEFLIEPYDSSHIVELIEKSILNKDFAKLNVDINFNNIKKYSKKNIEYKKKESLLFYKKTLE